MSCLKKINIFCILTILLLTGCEKKNDTKPTPCKSHAKALKINITTEPHTLDPRKARSLNDQNILKMFMEGLTRLGPESDVRLALCEKYSVSEDKKTYTFHLRNAKWSNNSSITADDFVYTWKKTLSPNFPSGQANLLYVIKNAEKVKKGLLPSSMLGVKAIGTKTLVVELENPTPYFMQLLSAPCFFPICSSVDKENPSWFESATTYISSGPFKLAQWHHNDQILAEKNTRYWDFSSVKLKNILMVMVDNETGLKMFENKELDWEGSPLSTLPLDALASLKSVGQVFSKPILGTSFLRLNVAKGPLKSFNFRKALMLALNRKEIVEHIYYGESKVATGFVPSSLELQKEPFFKDGNITEAKNYLAKALANNEVSREDLKNLSFSYIRKEKNHRLSQLIQDQWKKALDLEIKLTPIEAKVYFDKVRKQDYEIAFSSWEADFSDAINFLEVFRKKETVTNNTNWENTNYKKYLDQSYKTTDEKKRLDYLQQAEKVLIEEAPIIPIAHYAMAYVKHPKVKNVVLSDAGSIDFKWAFIDKEAKDK